MTSRPESAPVEAEQIRQCGRVVLALDKPRIEKGKQRLAFVRDGQDAALDGQIVVRRGPNDCPGTVQQLRCGRRVQVARGPGATTAAYRGRASSAHRASARLVQPIARNQPWQSPDHRPRADFTEIIVCVVVDCH